MLGVSRTIADGRTVQFEFMRIQQEEGAVYLMATPSGQREARFKLTKASAREVVFENPTHDFPQRITYKLEGKDSLVARISGMSKGKEQICRVPAQARPLRRVIAGQSAQVPAFPKSEPTSLSSRG